MTTSPTASISIDTIAVPYRSGRSSAAFRVQGGDLGVVASPAEVERHVPPWIVRGTCRQIRGGIEYLLVGIYRWPGGRVIAVYSPQEDPAQSLRLTLTCVPT